MRDFTTTDDISENFLPRRFLCFCKVHALRRHPARALSFIDSALKHSLLIVLANVCIYLFLGRAGGIRYHKGCFHPVRQTSRRPTTNAIPPLKTICKHSAHFIAHKKTHDLNTRAFKYYDSYYRSTLSEILHIEIVFEFRKFYVSRCLLCCHGRNVRSICERVVLLEMKLAYLSVSMSRWSAGMLCRHRVSCRVIRGRTISSRLVKLAGVIRRKLEM